MILYICAQGTAGKLEKIFKEAKLSNFLVFCTGTELDLKHGAQCNRVEYLTAEDWKHAVCRLQTWIEANSLRVKRKYHFE